MTKLQVALDSDFDSSLSILEQIHAYVDIAEVGTPLIYREGMRVVHAIRELYPHMTILADLKIMDAGEDEAMIAFEAGADMVTVLGVTSDATVEGTVKAGQMSHKQIVVDMMQVANLVERGEQLLNMGCNILCVHTAFDLQMTQTSPYRDLQQLREAFPQAELAIAGGVNLTRLGDILPHQPDIVFVGGAITRAENPAKVAHQFVERLHE